MMVPGGSSERSRRAGGARYPWLAVGFGLLVIANGRWILPPAAWLFPVGWLLFLDRSPRLSGLSLAFLAYVLANFVFWWGIIPAPGILYYLIAAVYASAYFVPFVLHRLLATRVSGLKATLVFPLAWVTVELIFFRWITPYGSWGSLAYSQSEQLALLQQAALSGTYGISFLMTWFASVVAWMLRPGLSTDRRVRAAATFGAVLLLVVIFGQLRLVTDRLRDSVRVAALVPSAPLATAVDELMLPARRGEPVSESTATAIRLAAVRLNDDLLERTVREARAGAEVVAWSEAAGRLFDFDEEGFIERARWIAQSEGVVLLLGIGVWHPDDSPPFDNKVLAIDAAGEVAWEYQKAHPVVGGESSFIDPGAGSLRYLDTGFGRVGAAICHDLDFPPLLRQSSARRIGLLVAPSADWSRIRVLHARMAVFRAVENGFNLLRPTSDGRTLAVDTRGRVTARVDVPGDAMVADVSAEGVRTIYGAVGDLFAWLCLAGLLAAPIWLRRGAAPDRPDRR